MLKIEMTEPRMMSLSKAASIRGFLRFLASDTGSYVSHLFLLATKKPRCALERLLNGIRVDNRIWPTLIWWTETLPFKVGCRKTP